MLLILFSIVLSLAIIGFGVFQGRKLFGAYLETTAQTLRLSEQLKGCGDGSSFKANLQSWRRVEDSVIKSVTQNLRRLFAKEPIRLHGRSGWVVDIDGLCDAKRFFKEHPSHEKLEALPGMLTGIGILCTFLGLAVGIFGLDPTDADHLTQGVKKLLGGMSLAFLTSIAGIGTALWWTWRSKDITGSFEDAFSALAKVLHNKTFLLIPEEMNYQFLDYQEAHHKALSGLETSIARAFEKALREAGVVQLSKQFTKSQNQDELAESLTQIRHELGAIASSLTRSNEVGLKTMAALKDLQTEGQLTNAERHSDLANREQLVLDTKNVLAHVGKLHQAQGNTTESIQKAGEELKQLMKHARLANSDIIKSHQSTVAHLERLDKSWSTHNAQVEAMRKSLDKGLVSFQEGLERSLHRVHSEIDGLLAESLTHFSGAMKEFEASIGSLSLVLKQEGQPPAERHTEKKGSWFRKNSP